jgi:uncharacterized protein YhfF
MEGNRIEAYWRSYVDTLPVDSPVRGERHAAEGWGVSPRMADELGASIGSGTMTATCSALWAYEAEGEPLPKTSSKTIVLDGNGEPLCIVETTEVEVMPYDQVDARFAYEEGEGTVRWSTGGMRTGATSHARCRALAESRLWKCRWYASGFV